MKNIKVVTRDSFNAIGKYTIMEDYDVFIARVEGEINELGEKFISLNFDNTDSISKAIILYKEN